MTTAQDTVAAKKDGLYVYCVARGEGDQVLGPIGLDSREVYTVSDGGLCYVVHHCQAQPYQSDDRQVAEGWVSAHHRVVEAATGAFGTVLPMSFNMIVQDGPDGTAIEILRAWMAETRDDFTRLLDKLTGKAEYGVQIFWDREVLAESLLKNDHELRRMGDQAKGKPKGLAYMLQQKLAKATRAALERRVKQYAEDFYARIRQSAEEIRVDKLKKTDGAEQMLLNLSCLMEKGCPALGRVLDEIQKTESISVRFTGPWPPYSFVCVG